MQKNNFIQKRSSSPILKSKQDDRLNIDKMIEKLEDATSSTSAANAIVSSNDSGGENKENESPELTSLKKLNLTDSGGGGGVGVDADVGRGVTGVAVANTGGAINLPLVYLLLR